MNVLALDSAMAACSAALWRDGAVVARRRVEMERGHAEALMPLVVEVMAEAGAAFASLDLIAATVGPGSFTGVRIGLAAARGLALAAGLPCLGVTTLEAVAHAVPPSELGRDRLLVALTSKRHDVHVQMFGPDRAPLTAPAAIAPEDLARLVGGGPLLVAGDATAVAVAALLAAGVDTRPSAAPPLPDAGVVAALAAARWRPGTAVPRPAPLYLRPPDVTLPGNGRRR